VKNHHYLLIALVVGFAGFVAYRHFVTKTPLFPKYGI